MDDIIKTAFGFGSGITVLENPRMTEAGEPYWIVRNLWERLFTRPWRPLARKKMIVPQVPMRKGLFLDKTTLVVHPEIANEFRQSLPEATQ